MSRTYKDRPYKVRFPESYFRNDEGYDVYEYEAYYTHWATGEKVNCIRRYTLNKKGFKTKKRREVDTEIHWMSTPSWWTREFMNRPMRSAGKHWERSVKYELDLEDTDPPGVGKKPHIYYW